ncbi:MAG: radical SAM protein [Pseudomonadota bacterium]
MRVLLISPKLPLSYWTLEPSCRIAGSKTFMPPLGLLTVAALLPREWELRLADLNVRSLRTDDWTWADMVMVSGMFIQREGVLEVLQQCKNRGKTVVVGGPYATSMPHEVLEAGADFVVVGEGENTVPDLLAALHEDKAQAVIKNEVKPEMSTSPVPRFDLLRLEDYALVAIQTSRGCPFNCEFCDIVNLFGRKPRYKNPDQVLLELDALHNLGWRSEVFVSDDNFIGNPQRATAILEELIPWTRDKVEEFTFSTQVSLNLARDPELMDLMYRANFRGVFIGIETPDEEVLSRNRKFQNIRNPAAESVAKVQSHGISVVGSFVIGFDGEKEGAGDRICAFVEQADIPIVMVELLRAFPNTDLYDRLERENRLIGVRNIGTGIETESLNYIPTRPEEQILEEYAKAWDYLYDRSRFLARAYRHFLALPPVAKGSRDSKKYRIARHGLSSLGRGRRGFNEAVGFTLLVWWQGVRSGCRRQWWTQLVGMCLKNPTRFRDYVTIAGFSEHMFRLRGIIRNRNRNRGT